MKLSPSLFVFPAFEFITITTPNNKLNLILPSAVMFDLCQRHVAWMKGTCGGVAHSRKNSK